MCWYDLEMQPEDFEDKAEVTKIINEWAASSAKIAKEVIDVKPDNDFPLQPLAGHTGLFATDKVEFRQNCNFAKLFMNVDIFQIIVAASLFLKVQWKPGLFHVPDTKMDQTFTVSAQNLQNEVFLKDSYVNHILDPNSHCKFLKRKAMHVC